MMSHNEKKLAGHDLNGNEATAHPSRESMSEDESVDIDKLPKP